MSLRELKTSLAKRFTTVVTAMAVFTAISGCSRSLEFKVVDGRDGKPIPGVTVERDSKIIDLILGTTMSFSTLPPTSADGLTREDGLSKNLMHHFAFTKPGFAEVMVDLWSGDPPRVQYLSWAGPNARETIDLKFDRTVTVRMYPATTAEKASK